MAEEKNVTESLEKLEAIVDWFENEEDVDVEQGLLKVKEAAQLIKDSRLRLAEIENEFSVIENEMGTADEQLDQDVQPQPQQNSNQNTGEEPIDLDNIPF